MTEKSAQTDYIGLGAADAENAIRLRAIRRVLNDSRDAAERRQAAQMLLPHLWDRYPWQRYAAGCVLTTRVYLPAPLMLLEWGSFPNRLTRELRRYGHDKLPPTPNAQRDAVSHTLGNMLKRWIKRDIKMTTRRKDDSPVNYDIAADVCEAIGRLGMAEAEADLLAVVSHFMGTSNQVRTAALLAVAILPPDQLTILWSWLRDGQPPQRRVADAAIQYMTLPEAVPFLLQFLPPVARDPLWQNTLARNMLLALGRIGDPRALPVLNTLARSDRHPLQPTAQKAIKILMKEAQGHEEVTLVRASGASSVAEDTLLRPSHEHSTPIPPEQLLRATTSEPKAETQHVANAATENSAQTVPSRSIGHASAQPDREANTQHEREASGTDKPEVSEA